MFKAGDDRVSFPIVISELEEMKHSAEMDNELEVAQEIQKAIEVLKANDN